jgi:hypothetical protein
MHKKKTFVCLCVCVFFFVCVSSRYTPHSCSDVDDICSIIFLFAQVRPTAFSNKIEILFFVERSEIFNFSSPKKGHLCVFFIIITTHMPPKNISHSGIRTRVSSIRGISMDMEFGGSNLHSGLRIEELKN